MWKPRFRELSERSLERPARFRTRAASTVLGGAQLIHATMGKLRLPSYRRLVYRLVADARAVWTGDADAEICGDDRLGYRRRVDRAESPALIHEHDDGDLRAIVRSKADEP